MTFRGEALIMRLSLICCCIQTHHLSYRNTSSIVCLLYRSTSIALSDIAAQCSIHQHQTLLQHFDSHNYIYKSFYTRLSLKSLLLLLLRGTTSQHYLPRNPWPHRISKTSSFYSQTAKVCVQPQLSTTLVPAPRLAQEEMRLLWVWYSEYKRLVQLRSINLNTVAWIQGHASSYFDVKGVLCKDKASR